jgi:RNA polymerase sigma-70 factor (ECF subfamily)
VKTSQANIIRRIASGEPAALVDLYDEHASLVFSLAARIVEEQDEAKEVVCEVFAEIWAQAESYDSSRKGEVAVWLAVLTRRKAIDRLLTIRTKLDIGYPTEAGAGEIPDPALPRAPSILTNEQTARLRHALAKLPLLQRIAIELAYFEASSRSKIAERLERSPDEVSVLLRDGLATLSGVLKATL